MCFLDSTLQLILVLMLDKAISCPVSWKWVNLFLICRFVIELFLVASIFGLEWTRADLNLWQQSYRAFILTTDSWPLFVSSCGARNVSPWRSCHIYEIDVLLFEQDYFSFWSMLFYCQKLSFLLLKSKGFIFNLVDVPSDPFCGQHSNPFWFCIVSRPLF